jgi:hypothetical protein
MMKKLIPAVFVLLALSVTAATALAGNGNTVWLCKGKQVFGTGNSRCLTNSENEGKFILEDRGSGAGSVQCEGTATILNEGWVGPGSEDETTLVEFIAPKTNCKPSPKSETLNLSEAEVTNVCETVENVEAKNLPWKSLLFLEGTASVDKVGPGTGGEPGYAIVCLVAGLKKTDTCTTTAAHPVIVNAENLTGSATEKPLVTITFPEKPKHPEEAATCSLGGAEQGFVRGKVLLEGLEGGSQVSLELSEE